MEFLPNDSSPPPILSKSRKKNRVPTGDQKEDDLFRDRFPLEGELTTDSICRKKDTSYGNPTPA